VPAAAQLLLTASRAAVDCYLQAAGPPAANLLQQCLADEWDRQMDRRAD